MGQGHAGARNSLCRTGFQPRAHCRGDPYRRPARTFGAADKPRLGESRLHDEERLRDLARLERLELRALVAASSRCGASLRCCFSITCHKRVGAGLEASVPHGAADHDHLLQRPSRHAGFTGARAFRQVPLGAATGRSSLAGTTTEMVAAVGSSRLRAGARAPRRTHAPGRPRAGLLPDAVHPDWRKASAAVGRLGHFAPGRIALTPRSSSRPVRYYLPRVAFYATVVVLSFAIGAWVAIYLQ